MSIKIKFDLDRYTDEELITAWEQGSLSLEDIKSSGVLEYREGGKLHQWYTTQERTVDYG